MMTTFRFEASMKKYQVTITQVVELEIDETKFDETFLAEFRESFYPFPDVERHAQHLAQLFVRSLWDGPDRFIEGYGRAADFGIRAQVIDQEEEIRELKE